MQTQFKPQIIFLMGPTASGKTQLAIELCERYPAEIISVDSAMVYKGMNIGTAKPSAEILRQAPHRLIDFLDPAQPYSAAAFRIDAIREINDILAQQKIPLLTGGTMMYFKTLKNGLADLPSADEEVRASLSAFALEFGWPGMHERLMEVDPASAARIHPHDAQRIQRALEVHQLTGKSLTSWHGQATESLSEFEIINLAVSPEDRAVLHARIAERFMLMLEQGLIEEVKALYERGDLNLELPAIRSVGYRQVWEYLSGRYTYEEMCEQTIIATRQLAKRQLTWLRNWSAPVNWFDSSAPDLTGQVTTLLNRLFKI